MRRYLLTGLLLTALASTTAFSADLEHQFSAPKDAAIINPERIAYWLQKNGKLVKDASDLEKQSAVNSYLGNLQSKTRLQPTIVQKTIFEQHQKYNQRSSFAHKSTNSKTVKVLAILIDFPDLKHDAHGLTAGDTDMYYQSYPVSHYQNLLFSETGFASRRGQNLSSVRQYFKQESGGTFNFTGNAFGWVTADHNARYYGENSSGSGDSDKNAPALVKEAVAKAVANNRINLADYDVEDPYDFDNDGELNEADGIIDHVVIFHSSIGEETGGGVLGQDAIWSHRYFADINTRGYQIPGTSKKVFGYTIQPIDAATGIVAHEFGHVLGLRDEYDTAGSTKGSPVGYWSVMADGVWAGKIAGSEPTGFSPYAKAYLQATYGGNWVREQVIDFSDLSNGALDVDLVEAVRHQGVNQLRIDLPKPQVAFAPAYSGKYQYYSGEDNNLNNNLSFQTTLPAGDIELRMKARWDMESERDYARVLVNGTAVAGNHTRVNNRYYPIEHFITGQSADISSAQTNLGWVDLTFDLSAFAEESVEISIEYITDAGATGYGLVIDELSLNDGSDFYNDGAEAAGQVSLNGFLRIDDKRPGKDQNYWVQLRSESAQDSGLKDSVYSPGILLWFADSAYSSNRVKEHPGHGFIGVVDADQRVININGRPAKSAIQVSDATFGLYAQKGHHSDAYLQSVSRFDDRYDYSLPEQLESGLVLPNHGLIIDVIEQAADNSKATIRVTKSSNQLVADFNFTVQSETVNFSSRVSGNSDDVDYHWSFGDGHTSNALSPSHTYDAGGNYDVTLTLTNGSGEEVSTTKTVRVNESSSNTSATMTTNNSTSSSGSGGGSSSFWLLGLLFASLVLRRRV